MMYKNFKIGLKFELHKKNYTLTRFREGLPLITCKETGQEQRISDKTLKNLLKGGNINDYKRI